MTKKLGSTPDGKFSFLRRLFYTATRLKGPLDTAAINRMKRILFCVFAISISAVLIGCNPQSSSNKAANPSGVGEDSPTGAYKRLYTAVKAKDTEAIKAAMTKKSLDFAKMAAAQQNKPVETVLQNGFTGTTFADSLPQIRDERVDGDMGAVEVHNDKENKWEDLPFVREDGSWKLAIGEMFANTWKSPGKSQSEKEREAANAMSNNLVPGNISNANANFQGIHPMVPKPATNVQKPIANAK